MGKAVATLTSEASGIEGLLGYNLKRAYMIVRDDFRRQIEQASLSPRVFSVLTLIVESPRLTQSEAARRLGIERSGMVAIIDELEAKGLAERAAVPGDRRSQALVATQKGCTLHARTLQLVQGHERDLLSVLDAVEQTQLLALLQKFRAAHEGDE